MSAPASPKAAGPAAGPAGDLPVHAVACPFCGAGEKSCAVAGLPNFYRPQCAQTFSFSRCAKCGLVFLDPRAEDLDQVYGDEYHKHQAVARRPGALKSYTRRLMHRVFLDYPPKPLFAGVLKKLWAARWARYQEEHGHMCVPWAGAKRGRLLDVGSGSGEKAVKFAYIGWQVTGVETDHEAAKRACASYPIEVRGGYLQEQKFPDGIFDAVTLLFVLEHVPDPLGVLKEIRRVLAPGGALMIDVPNFDSRMRTAFGLAWTQYSVPEHFLLPTEATLRKMLDAAGFRVEFVQHRGSLNNYRTAQVRAQELGQLDPALPTEDGAIRHWIKTECRAPHGELMLCLAYRI
ncbi:MAG: class I SAM-dependent methyltransferase [Planctomycetes bacterium]|nr:class I SAM-dependent methyltransferase [Planctomycetota bacterium]